MNPMFHFKNFEEELNRKQNITFEKKPPYGMYLARIVNLERIQEMEKNRERIRVTFQILEGEYQHVGLRENFYLTKSASSATQLFQYQNMKHFFQIIAPEIEWNYDTMDELEANFSEYFRILKGVQFQIKYQTDKNQFDRVYIQNRQESMSENEKGEDPYDLQDMEEW